MCLKFNFTGLTHYSIILCKKGAKLQGLYISPPNILKMTKRRVIFKSNIIMLYKSVKYSYLQSILDFGEENKVGLKLIFTTHKILQHRLEYLVGWNYYIAAVIITGQVLSLEQVLFGLTIQLLYCQNPNSTTAHSSIQQSLRLDYILTVISTPPPTRNSPCCCCC